MPMVRKGNSASDICGTSQLLGRETREWPAWKDRAHSWARSAQTFRLPLLSRHCHSQPFFGRNQVVVVVFPDIDLHPIDTAVEGIGLWAVIRRDGRRIVHTDIARFVRGKDHRLRHLDPPFADLVSVDIEGYVSTLPQSAAIVGKLYPCLMCAAGDIAGRLCEEVLHSTHVVAVLQLAFMRIEGPTSDAGALRHDDAPGPGVRHLDLGGDGERLVLCVDHRILGQAAHAAEEHLRIAMDQRRPARLLRDDALGAAVVQRQH